VVFYDVLFNVFDDVLDDFSSAIGVIVILEVRVVPVDEERVRMDPD